MSQDRIDHASIMKEVTSLKEDFKKSISSIQIRFEENEKVCSELEDDIIVLKDELNESLTSTQFQLQEHERTIEYEVIPLKERIEEILTRLDNIERRMDYIENEI